MVTKTIITIMAISVLSMLTGCSTQKTKTEADSAVTEQMVGAYTNHIAVSSEEKSLFQSTYKGDIKLTPVKVATQVVAGTNFSFICKDSKNNIYEVVIYEPLPGQGTPEVSSVTKQK